MNFQEENYLGIKELNVVDDASIENGPCSLFYKNCKFGNDFEFFDFYLCSLVSYGFVNEQDFDHRGVLVLEEFSESYPREAREILDSYINEISKKTDTKIEVVKNVAREAVDVARGASGKLVDHNSEVR